MYATQTLLPHTVTITAHPHPDMPGMLQHVTLTRHQHAARAEVSVTLTMTASTSTPTLDDVLMHVMHLDTARRVDPTLTPYEWEQWAHTHGHDVADPHGRDAALAAWEAALIDATRFAAWLPRDL